ncbi:MAG: hypothetical protein E6R04_01180 [Spirochaetes bacterium]|nr:MAG: hypothetical protein E6R04_01180 [Spirochaetota bacterium]
MKKQELSELERARMHLSGVEENIYEISAEIDQLEYTLEGLRASLAERQGLANQIKMDIAELEKNSR